DSGLDHALAIGIAPSLLVGDLDSVSNAGRAWAETHEVEICQHPPLKDSTDTELALAAAVESGVTDVVLLGILLY
ncbi:MAG TPA: hypothetical protein PLV68_18590, partial [Ilumatobacteraceae bacterium]|nr:hypothetical protein [Ilumatobacteraceae bacterium]